MRYKFSARSIDRMKGLHPDLVAVMHRAIEITPIDFTVIEGLRGEARQRQLVAEGKSQTMNSRHLTGHAIDVAPIINGKVSWDWKHYYPLAKAIKKAASELGVNIEWGGDWTSFKDGPHWQLSWSTYDKDDMESKREIIPEALTSTKPRSKPTQSRTVQASAATIGGAVGTAGAAIGGLDSVAQYIVLGFAGLIALLALFIMRERLKAWAAGWR